MTTLGIDVGGGSVKACLTRPDGSQRAAVSTPYESASPDTIRAAIEETTSSLDADPGSIDALGLCLPGVLDDARQRVQYAANLPGIVGASIESLLPGPLRALPRRVVPDALAAGMGAWLREPVSGRLLVLVMGTGVGAALLDSGRPVTLGGSGCGHVGQIDVSLGDDAPIGPDAGRGSLEAYVGLPALRSRFGATPADAIASLDASDPALRALARAIRVCHAMFTPEHVRLAGGVGAMLAPTLPALRRLIERDLTLVASERWSLGCIDDLTLAARGCGRLAGQPVPT